MQSKISTSSPRNALCVALPVFGVTAGTLLLSLAVAAIAAWMIDLQPTWQHYVFALTAPSIATPVWAVPLLRAKCRLARMARQLEQLARIDPLSGLPNRRAFFERGMRILAEADAAGLQTAVLMIDLDRFKAVNDALGHGVGDIVLCAVADTIRGAVADATDANDVVLARIGGEEFAVIAGKIDVARARALAARICARVRSIVCAPSGVAVVPTVSIGLAMREAGGDLDAGLRAADRAAYAAKRRGRDCWCQARATARAEGRHRRRMRMRTLGPVAGAAKKTGAYALAPNNRLMT